MAPLMPLLWAIFCFAIVFIAASVVTFLVVARWITKL